MIYVALTVPILFFVAIVVLLINTIESSVNAPLKDKIIHPGLTYENFLLLKPVFKITLAEAQRVLGGSGAEVSGGASEQTYCWRSEAEDGGRGQNEAEISLTFSEGRLICAEEKGLDPLFSPDFLSSEMSVKLAAFKGYVGGFQHINDKLSARAGKPPRIRRLYASRIPYWTWGKQERELVYRSGGGSVIFYLSNSFGRKNYLSLSFWFGFYFHADAYNGDFGKDCVFEITDVVIEKA